MDRQKKMVLQFIVPGSIVLLTILVLLIKSFLFSGKEKQEQRVTLEIPGVPDNIQEEKTVAYENERDYYRKEKSDFPLFAKEVKQEDSIKRQDNKSRLVVQAKSKEKLPSSPVVLKSNRSAEKKIKHEQSLPLQTTMMENQRSMHEDQVVFNSTTPKRTSKQHIIRAYIHGSQKVVNGSMVKLRVDEEFTSGDIKIPAHTFIYGKCMLSNDRVFITISSLASQDLQIYDIDGGKGIKLFKPIEQTATQNQAASTTRKIGATLSSAARALAGTNIAGQLSRAVTEGVINAATEGVSDNIKLKSVTLTNNYQVYLK